MYNCKTIRHNKALMHTQASQKHRKVVESSSGAAKACCRGDLGDI